jgi:hypothetical protein
MFLVYTPYVLLNARAGFSKITASVMGAVDGNQTGGMAMRARLVGAVLVIGAASLLVGCATSEDWRMWRSHNSHFASGDHAFFSMANNKDGSNPKVTRADIENSRSQNWWGLYAVNVNPSQIFQN